MRHHSTIRGLRAFSLLIALGVGLQAPAAFAARFVDTSKTWTERYINRLSDKGVISAEPDGKFNPDKPVTRAEFAAWLVKVLGLDGIQAPTASSYPDVKTTDWFFKSVEIAKQNNIMSGYADGFRPNANIQRAEMLALVARLLRTPAPDATVTTTELAKFKDASAVPEWAKTAVVQDVLAGVYINEAAPDELLPTTDTTRGDCAAVLSKLDEYLGKQAVDAALNTPSAPNSALDANYSPPPSSATSTPGASDNSAPIAGQVAKSGQPPGYMPPGGPNYTPQGGANYAPVNPPGYLQGGVSSVAAGTKFRAQLQTTVDSAVSRPGEQVTATINDAIYVNGAPVVPAGTRLIGSVTDAVSAKRFHAGANGKVDIHFTSMETPDGRRFPLSASVDGVRLSGGTTKGRIGKTAAATAIGAGGGALLGTAIGAIVGGAQGGGRKMGTAIGIGALMGTAVGGAGGAITGVVRKGTEIRLNSGMSLPLQLDSVLQMTAQQQPPPYGGGGYPQ